jgi:hypothetical protein
MFVKGDDEHVDAALNASILALLSAGRFHRLKLSMDRVRAMEVRTEANHDTDYDAWCTTVRNYCSGMAPLVTLQPRCEGPSVVLMHEHELTHGGFARGNWSVWHLDPPLVLDQHHVQELAALCGHNPGTAAVFVEKQLDVMSAGTLLRLLGAANDVKADASSKAVRAFRVSALYLSLDQCKTAKLSKVVHILQSQIAFNAMLTARGGASSSFALYADAGCRRIEVRSSSSSSDGSTLLIEQNQPPSVARVFILQQQQQQGQHQQQQQQRVPSAYLTEILRRSEYSVPLLMHYFAKKTKKKPTTAI